MATDGSFDKFTKKEALMLTRQREKLERNIGGIKNMGGLPGAMFVIDPRKESIAVHEARRLGIPVIALTDTNCDPDGVDCDPGQRRRDPLHPPLLGRHRGRVP